MRKAAIISAMKLEIEFVEKTLVGRGDWVKRNDNVYYSKEYDLEIFSDVLGVGKVNAAYRTAEIILEYKPDVIINVGFAGGLQRGASVGDLAIGRSYVQEDLHTVLPENRVDIGDTPDWLIDILEKSAESLHLPYYVGKIATGDYFLGSSAKKQEIIREHGAIAFDMETAAIAQVATLKNVDFVGIRTFSDLADDEALETAGALKVENRIPIEERPIVLAITALEKAS